MTSRLKSISPRRLGPAWRTRPLSATRDGTCGSLNAVRKSVRGVGSLVYLQTMGDAICFRLEKRLFRANLPPNKMEMHGICLRATNNAVSLPCNPGCFDSVKRMFALVISSGKDLGALATREEVLEDFGTPVVCGEVDGKFYEEFRSHRKISESWRQPYDLFADSVTLGFAEVILFPSEVYIASRRSIMGQTIRFVYDSDGYVKSVQLDGKNLPVPNPSSATDP